MRVRALLPLLLLPAALLFGAESAESARRPSATFRPLGDLPGGLFHSMPTGVSDDGQVVVGTSVFDQSDAGARAFRWTPTGGMIALPHLPNGDSSYANDVSADGEVIVGEGTYGEEFRRHQAFRWTQADGTVGLGMLPGATEELRSYAYAVSPDGSVVVGGSVNEFGGDQAFRWTKAGGMQPIPFLPGGQVLAYATDVSADGNTIVGSSNARDVEIPGFRTHYAFRWTPQTGTVSLHPASTSPPRSGASSAFAVSPDGRFVVGEVEILAGLFWSPEQGPSLLPPLRVRRPAEPHASATGVSADGKRVVGSSLLRVSEVDGLPVEVPRAVLWDANRRVQDLQKLLARYRVRLRGWSLAEATAITPDGRTIIGHGKNPAGQQEGWIVTLPPPR